MKFGVREDQWSKKSECLWLGLGLGLGKGKKKKKKERKKGKGAGQEWVGVCDATRLFVCLFCLFV